MIDKVKDWMETATSTYRGTLGEQRPAIESLSVNGGAIFGDAVLNQSSEIIIKSNPGSVPGLPEFGVGVSSYLDSPIQDTDPLSSIIEDNIARFDPRVPLEVSLDLRGGTLFVNLGGVLDAVEIVV